jgi:predicted lipoprotein with Yx(FWY)xxD motif
VYQNWAGAFASLRRKDKEQIVERIKSLGVQVVGLAVVASLFVAAIAVARSGPTVINSGKVEYETQTNPVTVTGLRNNSGYPLYMLTHDGKDRDRCSGTCALTFSPVVTSGTPVAKKGSGVNSKLLGTIRIKGGKHQVTYNHHALYTTAQDAGGPLAYEEACRGNRGTAYVVSQRGNAIKPTSPSCPMGGY